MHAPITARRDAVVFDMDGTLADVSSIRHLLVKDAGRPWKNFPAFHAASASVPVHGWVADAAREADADGLDVLVVTARKAQWRHHTAMFLALNHIPSAALFMRANDDNRKDHAVKADILARIRTRWNVVHAWDDNPSIIDLWKAEGIPVTVVPGWEQIVA